MTSVRPSLGCQKLWQVLLSCFAACSSPWSSIFPLKVTATLRTFRASSLSMQQVSSQPALHETRSLNPPFEAAMLAYATKAQSQCSGQARDTRSETGHLAMNPARDALRPHAAARRLHGGANHSCDWRHRTASSQPWSAPAQCPVNACCAEAVLALWAAHWPRIHPTRTPSCSDR